MDMNSSITDFTTSFQLMWQILIQKDQLVDEIKYCVQISSIQSCFISVNAYCPLNHMMHVKL